jgi:hypothetical protein
MLDQTVSRMPHAGAIEPPVTQHADRSMDVLQYATAFVAVVVAVLLAVLHGSPRRPARATADSPSACMTQTVRTARSSSSRD